MEDWIIFADGHELHGAGHYHETYEKQDGAWRIKTPASDPDHPADER